MATTAFQKPRPDIKYNIHELFAKRWSPRAFSEEGVQTRKDQADFVFEGSLPKNN